MMKYFSPDLAITSTRPPGEPIHVIQDDPFQIHAELPLKPVRGVIDGSMQSLQAHEIRLRAAL
jgi:hypothetical protein